jgi:hypothetical protein
MVEAKPLGSAWSQGRNRSAGRKSINGESLHAMTPEWPSRAWGGGRPVSASVLKANSARTNLVTVASPTRAPPWPQIDTAFSLVGTQSIWGLWAERAFRGSASVVSFQIDEIEREFLHAN